METEFEYYAFISYKREDEKWAKWLQNKLETYKLPTSLAKETGKEFPKTFHPCFRDKTDLSETGDLSKILHDKLQKSQYLIVVCSPRSAKSKWVNKEVETFQEMGRADKIIPFIIEGNPDTSNLNVHCYPTTLDENILGISIPELGKEKAAVKTFAAMLNVNFDTLWNRHRERVLQKRIKIMILCAIFIAVFGGFSTYQALKIAEQKDRIEEEYQRAEKLIPAQKQLNKIREIEESVKNINPDYFEYDALFKRFTLKNIGGFLFLTGSSDIHAIEKEQLERLFEVGVSIRNFVDEAVEKNSEVKYLLIVEGQTAHDFYPRNSELSYARALALVEFWKGSGLDFNVNNCEIIIAGSGQKSGFHEKSYDIYNKVNQVNQRFVIHIIPRNESD